MPSTILIVDDSTTIRAMVRRALEEDRHEVLEASHGAAALAALEQANADLVITDLLMPGMDGLALTRALRASERFRATPILVLTTEGGGSMKEQGRAAGATGWLVKPFQPDVLRQTVRRVLEQRA
ncbi:MAG TPA: response regulator [Candidatus Eisenbacteria bacterium]|nr:response regulator [Candidatus Eisenbacteria bacterium]